MTDPINWINNTSLDKSQFKKYIITKTASYHENSLRLKASTNSKMKYFNVNLLSLLGQPHPAIMGVNSIYDTNKLKVHLQMLTGSYMTYSVKSEQYPDVSPRCRICNRGCDNIPHILTTCEVTEVVRKRILQEMKMLSKYSVSDFNFENIQYEEENIIQFILDPSSMNLKERINMNDPVLPKIFKRSRDYCYAVHKRRLDALNKMALKQK